MNGAERIDIAVVGAGAAGLMAAIAAARVLQAEGSRAHTVVAFDGAKTLGAKILVAGGGRCNVTHHEVTADAYAAQSRNTVRNVLRRYGVDDTRAFFADLGVNLKQEDTGKLFPTTDRARTVLDALLGACTHAGVELRHPASVDRIERSAANGQSDAHDFVLRGDCGEVIASRVILCTGGKALPRSGSDGRGYALVTSLGHTLTERVFPALVPLLLEDGHPLRELSGIALPARLELRSGTGKRLKSFENSTLCTHFGLSGPAAMDMSRYFIDAQHTDPGAHIVANWLPRHEAGVVEDQLVNLGAKSVAKHLQSACALPDRFVRTVLEMAGVHDGCRGSELTKDHRRKLITTLVEMPLPIVGDRGFTHAEVTAGGVPMSEISIKTMESRLSPGLHLAGEILDVDGRIGGFNFQWAWATGHIAGTAAARAIIEGPISA